MRLVRSKHRRVLLLLLAVAWVLRIILVLRGGQYFWPDEYRHNRSRELISYVFRGDIREAIELIVRTPDHVGFVLVGSIPAAVHSALIRLGLSFEQTVWVPALILSFTSVACIALTYAVARRAGATGQEGLIAAFFMACATSMLYYARHLLPYDTAMALALLALWVGFSANPPVWRSVACGLLAGLAFLVYNAYWYLAVAVVIIHIFWMVLSPAKAIKRGAIAVLGLTIGLLFLTGLTAFLGRTPYILTMARFANTVIQGSFSEGWILPWIYLWHTEHLLLLIWGIGLLATVWYTVQRSSSWEARGLFWLVGVLVVYLTLLLGSTGTHTFVVYGRTARQLVPFLCLATAYGLAHFADGWLRRPWPGILIAALLIVLAAVNFAGPFRQRFPADVLHQVSDHYSQVDRDVTVLGPPVQGDLADQVSRYVLLNAQHLYPILGPKAPPAGTVLFETSHPLQFLPYQYEGYSPAERSILRSTDISMKLLETKVRTMP